MTEQELQLQYMLLENKYRLLEQSVAGMELRDSLSCELGLIERVNTTAISLFLLRKDREHLAESLGLKVADYVSLKSLGEQALEEILYKNADVITEFRSCLGLGATSVEKSVKTEDIQGVEIVEKSKVEAVENTDTPEVIKEVEIAKEVVTTKPMKVARNTDSDSGTEVKVQTGKKRGPRKKEVVLKEVEAKSKSVEVATGTEDEIATGAEIATGTEDESENALRGTEFTTESLQAAMGLWG